MVDQEIALYPIIVSWKIWVAEIVESSFPKKLHKGKTSSGERMGGRKSSKLFFFLRFDLFIQRDTDRERQRPRQREKQAPCRGTTGSPPEPKADAQPLSHPGVPRRTWV